MTEAVPTTPAVQGTDTATLTPTAPAVRVRGLRKTFGDFEALRGVSFDLYEGEFVTLLGPSGCGKTTTLRIIAGLDTATAGSIELYGTKVVDVDARIMRPPNRRPISMVFQSYALWPHLSALKNVMFPLENRGVASGVDTKGTAADNRARAMDALRMVKCDHLADRYPGEMSGGQQQRIALARALVVSPPLILLDEPLSNLDAALRRELRFELRALQENLGFTAIYVTHDQIEALSMSDRVILMNQGQLEQQAPPIELFSAPQTKYAAEFIGDHNLVRGTVVDSDDGVQMVDTPIGGIRARYVGSAAPPSKGADVNVAMRTDRLRVVPDAGVSAVAQVVGVAFCGAFVDVALSVDDGSELVIREYDGAVMPQRGQRVRLEATGEGVITDE